MPPEEENMWLNEFGCPEKVTEHARIHVVFGVAITRPVECISVGTSSDQCGRRESKSTPSFRGRGEHAPIPPAQSTSHSPGFDYQVWPHFLDSDRRFYDMLLLERFGDFLVTYQVRIWIL